MLGKTNVSLAIIVLLLSSAVSSASSVLLNEFEPNPAGSDPSMMNVELLGTPGATFDLWILSLENDGYAGTVDRASNVMGTFDSMGIATVMIGDLENPSFTVVLTDDFTGALGDDLDAADDGTLDLTSLGIICDAVGVSDNAGDDGTLYGAAMGGADILYNGQFEPLNVFREKTTGNWYQTVTVDFGDPTEHIGIFAAGGGAELSAAGFSPDPLSTTFGVMNPSLVPEPSSIFMIGLAFIGMLGVRNRK